MVYQRIIAEKQAENKQFALLIDPDKTALEELPKLVDLAMNSGVDYIFVGGSLLLSDQMDQYISSIKSMSELPLVIFPGSPVQISDKADAILLLSLISGRNPDLLIGQHVAAAPELKRSGLEILSTGYVLVDGGRPTTVSYVSNTQPIPMDKPDIAACTALAGEMLGLDLIYIDAGSGAAKPIASATITAVRSQLTVPLIVGGGIRTPEDAERACAAGADIIVIGTAIEENPDLLQEMVISVKSLNSGVGSNI